MADTQETPTSIIKSDRSGRTRYSQSYKDEVVAAYQQSNMSAAAFAQHCGVKYSTFAPWVAKVSMCGVVSTLLPVKLAASQRQSSRKKNKTLGGVLCEGAGWERASNSRATIPTRAWEECGMGFMSGVASYGFPFLLVKK